MVQRRLRPRIARPHAPAIRHRTVAALILLTFIGTGTHPNLLRSWFKTRAIGSSWDATSKHIQFTFFCSEVRTCDGCLRFANSDANNARTLSTPAVLDGGPYANDAEICIAWCTRFGYKFAGMESADECCMCFTWPP